MPVEFTYEGLPGRVCFAPGRAAGRLAEEVSALGLRRLMVITGGTGTALARDVTRDVAGLVAARFTGVRPHVPADVADTARRVAADSAADGLVTIGGGSATGTGKIVALTTGLPLICVPTTYAGSEVTPVWGMTTAGRKETGRDPRVLPRSVVYDADLTTTLPRTLTVASALNAMAHCVEAYWAPGANPVTSLIATEGIRLLAAGLREPGDSGREQLLHGSYLAGSAFAVAGSALHHKICHVLGGAFDLPHAETHAVLLPHVLAFNADAAPQAEAAIAGALAAPAAVPALSELYRDVGAPDGLAGLGLTREQLDRAVELVADRLPIANPRPVRRRDVVRILESAY
ncbi:maleylacetate reductase [Pseudonocardia sp.]|uniref:maleylacetate reductase n=1 Tax=Pseudonocardia sp. TaxID=60912 RepID=UPI003D0B5EDE